LVQREQRVELCAAENRNSATPGFERVNEALPARTFSMLEQIQKARMRVTYHTFLLHAPITSRHTEIFASPAHARTRLTTL